MQLAAQADRSLSEYVRMVLLKHAYGHAVTVPADDEEHQNKGA